MQKNVNSNWSLHYMFIGLAYSQPLYTETSQKVEKWMRILDVAFLKVTPIMAVGPATIVSFVKFFSTDLGASAFELPIPMW